MKVPSFFIRLCPEILALQEDLQLVFLGSQLRPFPAQVSPSGMPRKCRLGLGIPLGVETIYPANPHSIMFSNPNKYVYESPKCAFQGRLFE